MIFKRRAKPIEDDAEAQIVDPVEQAEEEDVTTGDDTDASQDEWAAFDASRDWRHDGPFDVSEVDLDEDEVSRLDLGSLIVTPSDGMTLQIIADEATGQGTALVAGLGKSAIQIAVLAAPQSGGTAADVREDILNQTQAAGAHTELAKGPFGTELRRVLPALDAEGNEGYAAVRDWFAEGPRWLLNGRLLGDAALDTENAGAARVFDEFFRNLVVRRGDAAMVPGSVIPLVLPTQAEA